MIESVSGRPMTALPASGGGSGTLTHGSSMSSLSQAVTMMSLTNSYVVSCMFMYKYNLDRNQNYVVISFNCYESYDMF